MSSAFALFLSLLVVLTVGLTLSRRSPDKMLASGDKVVLFKSVFRPLDLSPHGHEKLPVKVYRGNCMTDDPEFEEFCQEDMTLAEFTKANSPFHQIKFQRPCSLKLSEEIDALEREVEKKFTFLSKPVRSIHTFRISTQSWRFPSHFDPCNQLIMHVTGSKRWWVKNKDGVEGPPFVCEAGDVLYMPIGVHHRIENLSPVCCIANLGFSYASDDYKFYEKKSRMDYPIRAMNVDAGNDTYRKSSYQ